MTPVPGSWASRTDEPLFFKRLALTHGRRVTSLQQTRLVSRDADRSRRSRYAPMTGIFYHFGSRFKASLAPKALFHGAFDLALGGLFGDLAPLVVLLSAAGNGEL